MAAFGTLSLIYNNPIMITNPKIAGFQPVFREFRGFSLLFDAPAGKEGAAKLYTLLYEALQNRDTASMANACLFCPLPFPSYHVTVWDGVNDGNLEAISPAHRDYFRSYLSRITSSLELEAPFGEWIAESPLLTGKTWAIRFKFSKLSIWAGGQALVAQLEAADETSAARLEELEAARKALYGTFEAALGLEMYRSFTPHVSLGYFANQESAFQAMAQLGAWNAKFAETLEGATLQFDSISLFGFNNMANFFSVPPQPGMSYHAGAPGDLQAIQRLMGQHDFYRSMHEFYGSQLNQEAFEKMRSGAYAPEEEKTKKHEGSYYTSLILKLSETEGAPLFQPLKAAYSELTELIEAYFPGARPEAYLDSAHLAIRSILNYKEQSLEELQRYKAILHPAISKWLPRFSADTILYAKGLHLSLNSFKGLSIGIKIYPSTPLIQALRGLAGEALYNALDAGVLKPEDVWEEEKAARWHTKLTHSTGLRVRGPEFLPPWAPGPMPEREKAFIGAFEAMVEKYDNVIFGKISNIQLSDIFIRNGKTDKLIVGKGGGVELAME